jgi:hypothetical protein
MASRTPDSHQAPCAQTRAEKSGVRRLRAIERGEVVAHDRVQCRLFRSPSRVCCSDCAHRRACDTRLWFGEVTVPTICHGHHRGSLGQHRQRALPSFNSWCLTTSSWHRSVKHRQGNASSAGWPLPKTTHMLIEPKLTHDVNAHAAEFLRKALVARTAL